MIKVINIITDTNIGGAGTYLLNFLEHYDKTEIDMEVFLPKGSLLAKEIEKRGIRYTEIPFIGDSSFNIRAVKVLLKEFKRIKPDIVHTHAAFSARIAARLCSGCKIVYTRHSVFDQPAKLKTFPLKQINGMVNNFFSDRILTVSPAAADNLTQTGTDKRKITQVYNGVSKPKVLNKEEKRSIRKRYGLEDTDYIVAIIARLEEIKGHDYMLDAAKALKDTNIKFLAAGAGSREEHLKKRIITEKITNVVLIGFIKDIYEIENCMDLQINASYGTEATSISLLEGMSLKVPAVVSDFGGNPYVIENNINGLVVPKKNAAALAEGILKMKNDTALYKKCSENCAKIFEERYTAEIMAKNVCGIYRELTEGNHVR